MKKKMACAVLTMVMTTAGAGMAGAGTVAVDEATLQALQEMIKKQQAQLDSQAKAIAEMQKKLAARDVKAVSSAAPAVTVKRGDKGGLVLKGSDAVRVKLSAQVNRAVMLSDDGHDDDVFFVDNDASSTRVNLEGSVRATEDLSAGGEIELEYQKNASNVVSMDNQSDDAGVKKRKLEMFVKSERFGKLTMGHGFSASYTITDIDYSGTNLAGYSFIGANGGGLKFWDKTAQSYDADARVSAAFNNMDGLGRIDRVRYDSPQFAGFRLGLTAGEENAHDATLRYHKKYDFAEVGAGVAWAYTKQGTDNEDQVSGSAAILFPNGFNLSVAGGRLNRMRSGRDDATFYYAKVGQKLSLCPLGGTAISADYGRFEDYVANGDEGDAYGVQLVQKIDRISTELYLGYRYLTLESGDSVKDYDDISSFISGFRFKF